MHGLKYFSSLVDQGLHDESGSVFYTGDFGFSQSSGIYILGLNPGGDPQNKSLPTIGSHLSKGFDREDWSSYIDECWSGEVPGTAPIQRRIQYLFSAIDVDLRRTPASNLVFVRTSSEQQLSARFDSLAQKCWRFHEAVIQRLDIQTIVCLGATVGKYVRARTGASSHQTSYSEENNRHWKSHWHRNSEGLSVVTLSHPSRADWTSIASNPSGLLAMAIR